MAPFLDRLREEYDFCSHPDESFYVVKNEEDPLLVCRECSAYYSLTCYLHYRYEPAYSLRMAQLYVDWQQDHDISTLFETVFLRHRIPIGEIKTRYSTLFKGSLVLDALLTPFYSNPVAAPPVTVALDSWTQDSDPLLQTAFHFLKSLFSVERYFDTFVPYVQQTFTRKWERGRENLDGALQTQLRHFDFIHRHYSPYCLALDAIHVVALCYLYQDDLDSVQALVYDFIAKMCQGYYAEMPKGPADIQSFLDEHVPDNIRLQEFLRDIRTGPFTHDLFVTYWELKSNMLKRLNHPPFFEWIFPRILFDDYIEYYAFLVALSAYSSHVQLADKTIFQVTLGDRGTLGSPQMLEDCERKYHFVKKCLSKVKRFHDCMIEAQLQRKETELIQDDYKPLKKNYFWTKRMVRKFLDPEFRDELVKATHWLKELPLHGENEPNLERKILSSKYEMGPLLNSV